MKRPSLVLLLFVSIAAASMPFGALAADWKLVGESLSGPVFIDRSSVAPRGTKIKAWFVYNYKEPRQPPEVVVPAQYRSLKQLRYFDCIEKTATLIQEIKYREPMGDGFPIGTRLSIEPETAKFEDVEPETIPHAMLESACAEMMSKVESKGVGFIPLWAKPTVRAAPSKGESTRSNSKKTD